ncbi:MAG: glycosyltransferase [Acidobacteria bacterium]|nr:glycosyltransferase [Acidobacteriota bacterium]
MSVSKPNKRRSIVHIWSTFTPGLFAEPHTYLLEHRDRWGSTLLAARLADNGSMLPPHTSYLLKADVGTAGSYTFFGRLKDKFSERLIWLRFNKWCLNKVREQGGELVHAHFGETGVRILPLIRKSGLPLVVSFYGFDASTLLQRPDWVARYQEMFRYTDAIIVLSESVKERMTKIGCDPDKVHVWRIPVDLDFYDYQPRVPTGTTRFLICARFVEKKGYTYLLASFEKLVRSGRKVHLTMIGYGPLKEKIDAEIEKRGLVNHTTIIDTELRSDFPDIYRKALTSHDIFVLPSVVAKNGDDEAGPALTMIIAQAAGLPVICTDFSGAEMSVVDGKTGLLCESNSSDDLAEKMSYLAASPQLWTELGARASEFVRKRFASDHQMKEITDIYTNILTSAKRRG